MKARESRCWRRECDSHGTDPLDRRREPDTFPDGTTLLTGNTQDCGSGCRTQLPNPFPSNFKCNPSSIDGLGVTNSSQGGGGIFVHGWAHNLEIANNRVYNNQGTLTGGITIGQGEHPTRTWRARLSTRLQAPARPATSRTLQLPYCFDMNREHAPQRGHVELLHGRRIVLGHSGGSGRRHLLHRLRQLQVQLQLGVRQHEHR